MRVLPNERIGHHLAVSLLEGTPYVARLGLRLAAMLRAGMPRNGHPGSERSRRCLSRLRGGDREPVYRQIVVLDR